MHVKTSFSPGRAPGNAQKLQCTFLLFWRLEFGFRLPCEAHLLFSLSLLKLRPGTARDLSCSGTLSVWANPNLLGLAGAELSKLSLLPPTESVHWRIPKVAEYRCQSIDTGASPTATRLKFCQTGRHSYWSQDSLRACAIQNLFVPTAAFFAGKKFSLERLVD